MTFILVRRTEHKVWSHHNHCYCVSDQVRAWACNCKSKERYRNTLHLKKYLSILNWFYLNLVLHAQNILHVCQYMALLTISHLWKKLCYDFAYRIHIIYYLDKYIWLCHFYIPAPKSWEWGILVLFYTCRKFLCFTVRRCLTC